MATGIQGMHTVPEEIFNLFGVDIFEKFLPGWKINGIYNYVIGAETALAAAQLDILQQRGSHKWINAAIKDLLTGSEWKAFTPAEKTKNLAVLVNVLKEAGSKEALATLGARTGGIVLFSNLDDPKLLELR